MFHGNKSDLIDCIVSDDHKSKKHPNTTCIIVDGAALVRRVKPQSSTTFAQYVENELKPKIFSHFSHADRVDVVFDQYKSDSIKTGTCDD